MAKVSLVQEQKVNAKVKHLPKIIRSNLASSRVSQEKFGVLLGMSQQAVSYKLTKSSDCWTYGDLLVVIHETEMSDEDILKLMKY